MKKESMVEENPYQQANGSIVNDEEKNRIIAGIERLMKTEKIFSEKKINLSAMAEKIGTNNSYLSRIINEHYGMSFSNFINHYRVREIQRLFSNGAQKNMTMEGIAHSVGFHSKPSFYAAFKKITGVTPTVYLRNLHEISKEKISK